MMRFINLDLMFNAISNNSKTDCLKVLQTGDVTIGQLSRIFAFAIRRNRLEIVEFLLNRGYEVPSYAISLAATIGNIKLLKSLFRHATEFGKNNYLPLRDYVSNCGPLNCTIGICKILIENGAEFNTKEYPMLLKAVKNGNIDAINTLLYYGVNPLEEYTGKYCEISCNIPLKWAFSLPSSTVEIIIKYAALHIPYGDLQNSKQFLANFTIGKARPYLRFAQSCFGEIRKLKKLTLNSNELNFLDMISPQENRHTQILQDIKTVNDALDILIYTSLPIYKSCILKRFKRKDILRVLTNFSFKEYSSNSCDQNICLDLYSVKKIYNFLSKKDLISMWLACSS